MPRMVRWAMPALMLAGAAGCGDEPLGPDDMRMLIAPEAVALYVGEQTPVAAQVVRDDGRVVDAATVLYWSEAPLVANVTSRGLVSGVTPGTTYVVAAYGTVQAKVAVTVAPDDRGALHQLDLAVAEVFANTRNPELVSVGFTARDGYGSSICDRVELAFRSDPTVATASNGSTDPGNCRILIRPYGWGRTYVVASSGGVSDSVLVTVTSTEYRAYFSEAPVPGPLPVGSVVRFVARVEGEDGAPLAGRAVAFGVSGGSLDSDHVVTDQDGKAAVSWTLPAQLRDGNRHVIQLRTTFPDGRTGMASSSLGLVPGPPVALQFYQEVSGGGRHLLSGTPHFPRHSHLTIYAVGRDAHGNLSEQPWPRFSPVQGVTTNSGCGNAASNFDEGSLGYGYCWAIIYGFWKPGTHRLTAELPGMFQDHLDIVID